MSFLTIIAGPNGAGKSTLSSGFVESGNVDVFDFDKEYYRIWSKFDFDPVVGPGAHDQTNELFLERKSLALISGTNFAFETNFNNDEVLKIVAEFKNKRYKAELIFICLDSAEAAMDRVKTRVAEGGHAISESTIRERFKDGLSLLDRNFELFDYLTLYWSSDHDIELIASMEIVERKILHGRAIPVAIQDQLPGLGKFIDENIITE